MVRNSRRIRLVILIFIPSDIGGENLSFEFDMSKFIDFRDKEACKKVRRIKKSEITEHESDDFNIEVIEKEKDFFSTFAIDLVKEIKNSRDKGEEFVTILPVGPVAQYPIAAKLINEFRIPCDHVHTFNMDEYADENGNTPPADWKGSFRYTMEKNFFERIDNDLRPPKDQIHYPTSDNIENYGDKIEELGGADVCYGGIGWCGHIAFWDSHLGHEVDSIEEFKKLGPRVVELHPMTILQNSLHSFGGDWSSVPPKAVTIGPKEIMEADHRSFWLCYAEKGGLSWQRFIARLVMHGPVTPLVPGSVLQTEKTDMFLTEAVAENVETDVS